MLPSTFYFRDPIRIGEGDMIDFNGLQLAFGCV